MVYFIETLCGISAMKKKISIELKEAMKKKKRLKRKTELIFNVEAKSAPQKIMIKYDGGKLSIIDMSGKPVPMSHVKIIHSRERVSSVKKGDKILNIIKNSSPSLSVNKTMESFSAVYAVDTNTKNLNGIWYSKGVALKLTSYKREKDTNNYKYEITLFNTISSENMIEKSEMEQAVWNKIIVEIMKNEKENSNIALIVDCDLDRIELYNSQILKIRDDKYLPTNFTLVYASADNNDNICNIMIKLCDKMAKTLLDQCEETVKYNG